MAFGLPRFFFRVPLVVALPTLLLLSACAGELAPPGETTPPASRLAAEDIRAAEAEQGLSLSPGGWHVLGEFVAEFDPITGRAHVEMVEPDERKSAAVPGMYQGLRNNEEETAVAGRMRFLQDAAGNGQTVGACEAFWSAGWGAGDPSWPFWVPSAARTFFLEDLAGDIGENRFCTNFRLINDVGRPLSEIWIIVDGVTIPGVRAWVQDVPRVIPGQIDGDPDVLLEPNSAQGMFRYGDFEEDEEVIGQWYFYFGGAAVADFRVRGQIVEIFRERCATGSDDNGDGLDDSGCGQFHAGADCSMNQDCVSGDCAGGVPIDPQVSGSGVLGSCQPSDEFGACFLDTDCAGTLNCIGADLGSWVAGTCQNFGGACTEDADCTDSVCDPVHFECRQPLGAPCAGSEDCVGDAFCEGAPTVCTPVFVTRWNTANLSAGSTPDNQVRLPLASDGSYNFTVDWGDGSPTQTITAWNQAEVTHTYPVPGMYTVEIRGQITGWRFNDGGDRLKLLDISSFGPLRLGNSGNYFHGAQNLTITATDVLDLTGTTSMVQAFDGCSSLTTVPSMNAWDTSSLTNLGWMFLGASAFNQPVDNWDTSNVTSLGSMFNNASAFNQPINSWNTSSVTWMTTMFSGASAFNQPLDNWDTSEVTGMAHMFSGASAFNQPLNGWDTSKVTSMSYTFSGASAFNQPLDSWNTGSVTTMYAMFAGASVFNQPLDSWNTGSVNNMGFMFNNTHAFNRPLASWDTGSVTSMNNMFHGALAFNQDLSTWCVSSFGSQPSGFDGSTPAWVLPRPNWGTCPGDVPIGGACSEDPDCVSLFCDEWLGQCRVPNGGPCAADGDCPYVHECGAGDTCTLTAPFVSTWETTYVSGESSDIDEVHLPLTELGSYDFLVDWGDGVQQRITSWDQEEVTHIFPSDGEYTISIYGEITGFRFANTGDRLKLLDISAFGPLRLGNEGEYFRGAENMEISATDALVLTGTTSLQYAFRDCTSLTGAHFMVDLDTSNVTSLWGTFYNASNFDEDISGWDTSNVLQMRETFRGATSFSADISEWDTGSVTNMTGMFAEHTSFNVDISGWDTANVSDVVLMFYEATSFDQPIGSWDVSGVTNMQQMFHGATSFNQPLNAWQVGNVTNMSYMFDGASSFNQPLDNWDTSEVTTMTSMFEGASVFNQPIGGWNTGKVTAMGGMFRDNPVFNQNLDGWDTGEVTAMQLMFMNASNFNGNIDNWNTGKVTNFNSTFQGASNFNRDISGWNTSSATFMSSMFGGASVFNQNLSGWCVTNFPSLPAGFDSSATAWANPSWKPQWGTCP